MCGAELPKHYPPCQVMHPGLPEPAPMMRPGRMSRTLGVMRLLAGLALVALLGCSVGVQGQEQLADVPAPDAGGAPVATQPLSSAPVADAHEAPDSGAPGAPPASDAAPDASAPVPQPTPSPTSSSPPVNPFPFPLDASAPDVLEEPAPTAVCYVSTFSRAFTCTTIVGTDPSSAPCTATALEVSCIDGHACTVKVEDTTGAVVNTLTGVCQ